MNISFVPLGARPAFIYEGKYDCRDILEGRNNFQLDVYFFIMSQLPQC